MGFAVGVNHGLMRRGNVMVGASIELQPRTRDDPNADPRLGNGRTRSFERRRGRSETGGECEKKHGVMP